MREKFELLIQINSSIEKGEIPNLDDIFHADYLYLKDNTLVNRDEHVEFMRKEFTRKMRFFGILSPMDGRTETQNHRHADTQTDRV